MQTSVASVRSGLAVERVCACTGAFGVPWLLTCEGLCIVAFVCRSVGCKTMESFAGL